ncbi:MAG: glucose-6-phosphate isomerase [Phycisphaeraceae bacterium]
MDQTSLYKRYRKHLVKCPGLGISLDVSRMSFDDAFLRDMEPAMQSAFQAMDRLENGEVANPDENRMVGHYWLRAPGLAPTDEITSALFADQLAVKGFAADVHAGTIKPPRARKFTDVLQIGIGGSALGPMLVADALGSKRDKLRLHFLDNTDPDGMLRTLEGLGARLKSTLVLVVSKSGGTPETRNGMRQTAHHMQSKGLEFARQAVAITGKESRLDQQAQSEGWLARFPMYDWVGGRTSVMATVGLVPAALQGIDVDAFLEGARKMDELTRVHDTKKNPAARLALMWHHATGGRGEKQMVMLPYKDRMLLLSRYLQQLVMESLGKGRDLDGNAVKQGITVFGNKGSTDQHAYIQQLREGLDDFFATFIHVLRDVDKPSLAKQVADVEDGVDPGDYLTGFYLGTRRALHEAGRESMTITCDRLDAKTLGAIIALYERAVGFYASLVNINAYHQPGVEAGKKAAADILDLQKKIVELVKNAGGDAIKPDVIAERVGRPEEVETVVHLCEHLHANKRHLKRSRGGYAAR